MKLSTNVFRIESSKYCSPELLLVFSRLTSCHRVNQTSLSSSSVHSTSLLPSYGQENFQPTHSTAEVLKYLAETSFLFPPSLSLSLSAERSERQLPDFHATGKVPHVNAKAVRSQISRAIVSIPRSLII